MGSRQTATKNPGGRTSPKGWLPYRIGPYALVIAVRLRVSGSEETVLDAVGPTKEALRRRSPPATFRRQPSHGDRRAFWLVIMIEPRPRRGRQTRFLVTVHRENSCPPARIAMSVYQEELVSVHNLHDVGPALIHRVDRPCRASGGLSGVRMFAPLRCCLR
jgi:hypothetical protein